MNKNLLFNQSYNLRLNFYENTPVQKKIFEIIPQDEHIAITDIIYSIGSMDLSVNGYIKLIASKVDNPDVYSVAQNYSQILLDIMTSANNTATNSLHLQNPIILVKNEPLYIFLYSNIPDDIGCFGTLNLYYQRILE